MEVRLANCYSTSLRLQSSGDMVPLSTQTGTYGGLVQVLVLCCTPPPQEYEQAV